ncbi:hypothetical protein C1H21_19065 [Xanthomonas arboricola pv. juglandis]|nr:hypothetical protein C1H21_19065 [Xanthomonas arboricola pv. juglandis]
MGFGIWDLGFGIWDSGFGLAEAMASSFLLPSGEGAPQGRMRVRAKPRESGTRRGLHRRPYPTPLHTPTRACGAGAPKHARK